MSDASPVGMSPRATVSFGWCAILVLLGVGVFLAMTSVAVPSVSLAGDGAGQVTPGTGLPPWIPAQRTTWQWQLVGPVDTSVDAQMYDIDLFNTGADVVGILHNQGRRAVCYMSAGTHEDWRPDAADFPGTVVGNSLEDWPGEHWLDIRQLGALAPVMQRRLDLCQSKGFDGVEFDNVDGYANSSGFPLTALDQLTYNKWLAEQAHQRGLSVGLKNDLDQVVELVGDFDWALVEQCFEYRECDKLRPFIQTGKAVFETEYNQDPASFCARANAMGFSAIKKNLLLDTARTSCL